MLREEVVECPLGQDVRSHLGVGVVDALRGGGRPRGGKVHSAGVSVHQSSGKNARMTRLPGNNGDVMSTLFLNENLPRGWGEKMRVHHTRATVRPLRTQARTHARYPKSAAVAASSSATKLRQEHHAVRIHAVNIGRVYRNVKCKPEQRAPHSLSLSPFIRSERFPSTETVRGRRVAAPEHSCALITLWLSGEIAGKRLKHGPDEDG